MAWSKSQLETPSGAKLQLYTAAPASHPKAIVQINHGMAEHAARYERFAMNLVSAGYAVVAHDHRGHGATQTPDASLGAFGKGGFDAVIADVHAINKHATSLYNNAPVICFGHSMGAIIALNYAMRHPSSVAALAAWNSGVETNALTSLFKLILKTQRMFKGSDVPSGIAKTLTFDAWNKEFSPTRTEFDWLSRDEAEVDKYVADPLCGFPVTIGLWLGILGAIDYAADDKNLSNLPNALPVHLQAGDKDPCSEHGKAVAHIEARMKNLGQTDVTFNLLGNTRHESLNEINRDEITSDFIAWLDHRFG